ncbi:RHS repeat-associated core domain-containing protein [Austwickia chelonae]|uniref:RHS repeat-associated core domain-containing protein n=1 Tax=Austwickia chelonae TaxID=100225 RepID=UPI000E2898E4|nr:RHS repeat-associated core domain-containing protein [Austwickia chelonae]
MTHRQTSSRTEWWRSLLAVLATTMAVLLGPGTAVAAVNPLHEETHHDSSPATTALWGQPLNPSPSPTPTSETPHCPLGSLGQIWDQDIGWYYNHHRWYDPTHATFTTPDPTGLPGGINPHTPVPNPHTWTDPHGLTPGKCPTNTTTGITPPAAKSAPQLVRPPLSIPRAQFGTKWGKHSKDYGLNPGDPAARAGFTTKIRDVHLNPTEVRIGAWNPETGGGNGYFFFRQGEDLLITKPDGQFVTMFPGASGNSWFQGVKVFS